MASSTPNNSRQSFEISKHDPLYMEEEQYAKEDIRFYDEHEEVEEEGEVESLLFASKQRRLSLDEMDFVEEHDDGHNVVSLSCCCSAQQSACFLLLMSLVGIVSWVALTQDVRSFHLPSPSTNHKLPDVCQALMNTSIDELMAQIGNTTEPQQRCYEQSSCTCRSTLEPAVQSWEGSMLDKWNQTFARNRQVILDDTGTNYDVVFYGDSITEHWIGTDLATKWKHWLDIREVFDKYFNTTSSEKASYDGIPLGIGGDKCGQLLYRIQNGELPDALNPKVFWILIGTNDLGAYKCSAEAVAAGNILIVEELQARRPNAKIVLNSMLPRGAYHLGDDMSKSRQWHEVQKVNQWLQCYADSMEGVEFFNSTPHFVVSYDDKVHQVENYYQDGVHPSAKGSKSWAKAIVKRLEELIP